MVYLFIEIQIGIHYWNTLLCHLTLGYIMTTKKNITTFLILFFAFSIYGKDTLVTIFPYASGEIKIPHNVGLDTNGYYRFEDTISFTNGLRLAFLEFNHFYTSSYGADGAFISLDTHSLLLYKFSETIYKDETLSENPVTLGNNDTIWNNAMSFPDSCFPIDTFFYDIHDPAPTPFQAKAIYYIREEYMFEWGPFTDITENMNVIVYIQASNNTYMKIQIYDMIIREEQQGPQQKTYTYPDTITLLWAADSCGNGIFKHDPTSNKKNKIESQTKRVFISNFNGMPYLHLSNMLDNTNGIKIDIFDLKGRKILQKHMKYLKPINVSQFHSGIYLVHITTGEKNIIRNFILSK